MRINSLEELEAFAGDFLTKLQPRKGGAAIVGLKGDLGAGKTAFTKVLAKQLGVPGDVTSPTFVIEKIYKIEHEFFSHLIHIDAYRLESGKELLHLGWERELADEHNLIVLEWPERVSDIMPEETIYLGFTYIDENTRDIIYG